MADTIKRRDIIPNAKLDRMSSNLQYIRRSPVDGPMIHSFGYDHGHLLIVDTKGKRDLLADRQSNPLVRDAARILHELSPINYAELVRGYRLAKAAGILNGADEAITEVQELYADGASFRIDGDAIYNAIKRAQRKPGGFDV